MFNWFKKKRAAAEPAPVQEVSRERELFELQAGLLAQVINGDRPEHLKDAEIEAANGVVYIRPFNFEIICNVLNQTDHGHVIVYHLGFIVKVAGEGVFYEELAAIGNKPFVALLDGVTAFRNGFLTGFLNCYFGHYEPAYELHGRPGDRFHLTYSELLVQGGFRDDTSLDDQSFVRIMHPLLKEFFGQLAEQETYRFKDYYWVKMYLSRQGNGQFIGECRFNNQEWNMGLNALIVQDYEKWKKTDGFLGKKQFIFIKKCA
jgi:hypothetical protein